MDNEKKTADRDAAAIAKIQILVGKTKSDSNPDELEHLKKIIKQNVPFTLRGYFMAYLLRDALSGDGRNDARKGRSPRAQQKDRGTAEEAVQREQKPLPEGARTLYMNVGKMRHLYPRELSQIIQDALGITKEDIYAIRIHDKYSFISMSQENCDACIEKLNGTDIRGRTISISYSNKE